MLGEWTPSSLPLPLRGVPRDLRDNDGVLVRKRSSVGVKLGSKGQLAQADDHYYLLVVSSMDWDKADCSQHNVNIIQRNKFIADEF
jgi:hypothetical protein